MKLPLAVPIAVLLASLVLLLAGIDRRSLGLYDEGVIVYGAARVLDGEVPHRDFWSVYPPGQFLAIAGLFKIFGPSLLVERVWDAFVRAAIALVTYLIADRLTTRDHATVAWLMCLGWVWVVGFYGYPLLPAALFTMISAYFFIRFLQEPKNKWMLFAAGMSIGVAATFRHDIGFYTFLAEGVSLAVFYALPKQADAPSPALGPIGFRGGLLSLCMGTGLAGLPVALYLVLQVPLSDLWSQLFVFPTTVYLETRSIPYPTVADRQFGIAEMVAGEAAWELVPFLKLIPFYFHFVVLAAAVIFLVTARTNSKEQESLDCRWRVILFLAILIAVLFLKSLVRPSYIHLIHVVIPSLVLAFVLMKELRGPAQRAAALLVGLSMIGMAGKPLGQVFHEIGSGVNLIGQASSDEAGILDNAVRVYRAIAGDGGGPIRARYVLVSPDQVAAVEFIQARVPEDEKIFVGNLRHDRIFISDVMFYFLSGRHSGTKFHELHPGLTTTAGIQRQIIDDLIDNSVVYVVLYEAPDSGEPNKSSESSHVTLLDDFLAEEFEEVAQFGKYRVRKKRDVGL